MAIIGVRCVRRSSMSFGFRVCIGLVNELI